MLFTYIYNIYFILSYYILGNSVRVKKCNRYVDENCYDKTCCTACLSLYSNTLLAN
jgi:hypothetical protein